MKNPDRSDHHTPSLPTRNIRVFISSTFEDMQPERQELVSKVFPLLRRKAQERQVTLSEIDLRWGISKEASEESKVVQICLEEIDRSRPFFIGILGGRYGWQPVTEPVDWHRKVSSEYAHAIDGIYQGQSMTELEIRHGTSHYHDALNAAFYIKDLPEDAIDPRQKQLRNMVREQQNFPISTYHNVEDLAQAVIRDFTALLDRLYPAEESHTQTAKEQQQYSELQRAVRHYVPLPDTERTIRQFMEQNDTQGLLITGESGLGKSTLLAKIALDLYLQDNKQVISFFPANRANGATFDDLSDWICQSLQAHYHFDYDPSSSPVEELQRAAATIHPDHKLFLVIDGWNQIVTTDQADYSLLWWPQWDKNIYIICSATEDSEIYHNLQRLEYQPLPLVKLNLDQRVELAQKFLKKDFNKTLSVEQLNLIGRTNKLLDNTLLFVSFLDAIRQHGDFETVTSEMERLTSFTSPDDFFQYLLRRHCAVFSDNEQEQNLYRRVLLSIYVSRVGLPEEDLIALTGITRMGLSILLGINSLQLAERNGRIVFAHDAFRRAVKAVYGIPKDEQTARQNIVRYYTAQQTEQREVIYQYYQLGDYDQLYKQLAHFNVYREYIEKNRQRELSLYWNRLLQVNPYRYDIMKMLYTEFTPDQEHMSWIGMQFYVLQNLHIHHMQDLANFVTNTMRRSHEGSRLQYALLKMIENEQGEYDDLRKSILQNLRVSDRLQGKLKEVLAQYAEHMDECEDMSDPSVGNIGEIFLSLYEQDHNAAYLHYAQDILQSVLAAQLKKYGTEVNHHIATTYSNYAAAISYTEPQRGMELHKKSLAIYQKLYGFYHVDVAFEYSNIAMQLLSDQPAEAAEYAENALRIFIHELGEDAPDTMEAHQLLAKIYVQLGDPKNALQHYVAMEQYLLRCGTDNAQVETLMELNNTLGKLYHLAGDREQAHRHYDRAYNLAMESGHIRNAQDTLCFHAQIWVAYGELGQAMNLLQHIIDLQTEHRLADSTTLAYAYYNLALLQFQQTGDSAAAMALIKKAIAIREPLVDNSDSALQEYKQSLATILLYSGETISTTNNNGKIVTL